MTPLLRHLLLATLLASAGLALWPEPAAEPVVEPAVGPAVGLAEQAVSRPVAAASRIPPGPGLPTRPADWPDADAQALQAWQATAGAAAGPAAAALRASAPERPAVPSLPYQWIGVLDDGQGPQALLAGPHRSLALRVGQTLDRDWRLDAVSPDQLTLTWLPGNQRLGLSFKPRAALQPLNPASDPP